MWLPTSFSSSEETRDSGLILAHVHSLVLDNTNLWNKFDMEEVMVFLGNAQVNYLIETFETNGYWPWVDGSAAVIVRRLGNIFKAMERHTRKSEIEAPNWKPRKEVAVVY